ncbi:MAG: DUF1573 domain-containing protein [Prevotella sp.]|nr:DUF1573 domain-containing protein [Prevotella sp.]
MNTKIAILSIGMLVALASPCRAQRIEAKNQVLNVGQVMFRQPVVVEYELHNKSSHDISITNVRTSCGCTTVDYPEGYIHGDADFTVRATYDAKTMGHFEKQIGIYTTDSNEPLMLTLKGIVVDEVVDYTGDYPLTLGDLLVDMNNIEFDDVNQGDRPMAKIHILNNTDQTVQPIVMHTPGYIIAEVSPSKIRPGRSGVALITLDTRKIDDYGLTQTSVYLGRQPGDKVAPNKQIDISAVLLPSFNDLTEKELQQAPHILLSTTTLDLGPFNGKKKLKGEIEIQNVGKSQLDITKLQMFTVGLQVSLNKSKLAPGEYAKLKITAMERDLRLVRSPRVLMITNDPEQPKVVIEVKTE